MKKFAISMANVGYGTTAAVWSYRYSPMRLRVLRFDAQLLYWKVSVAVLPVVPSERHGVSMLYGQYLFIALPRFREPAAVRFTAGSVLSVCREIRTR